MRVERTEFRDNSPEGKFAEWKHTVGLPEQFPKLQTLNDSDLSADGKLYLGLPHRKAVERIALGASGAFSLALVMNEGQGATTLSRHVFNIIERDSLMRRLAPVSVDVAKLAGVERPAVQLEDEVRFGIVSNLASHEWAYVSMERSKLATLFGIDESKLGIDSEKNDSALKSRQYLLKAAANTWKAGDRSEAMGILRDTSVVLAKADLDVVIQWLSTAGIDIKLIVDLSSDSQDESYNTVLKKIHELSEKVRPPKTPEESWTPSSPLSDVYFGTQEQIELVARAGRKLEQGRIIEFPAYSNLDIFAILSKHYKPANEPSLATVLDPALVDDAHEDGKRLGQIVYDLEQDILEDLSTHNPSYRLAKTK